jgi:hypothetical protein
MTEAGCDWGHQAPVSCGAVAAQDEDNAPCCPTCGTALTLEEILPHVLACQTEEDVDKVIILVLRVSALAPSRKRWIAPNIRLDQGSLFVGTTEISLTRREADVLDVLARHIGLVLSRRQIIEAAFPHDFEGGERAVDAIVCRLRRKLAGDPIAERLLETVPGRGYRLRRL